jgi:hypothetical protein
MQQQGYWWMTRSAALTQRQLWQDAGSYCDTGPYRLVVNVTGGATALQLAVQAVYREHLGPKKLVAVVDSRDGWGATGRAVSVGGSVCD